MHLVHVFPTFAVGGSQVRFAALAQALGDRYRHTVISLSNSFEAASLLPLDAPVDYVEGLLPDRSALGRLRAYLANLRALKPDLLLTYNWGAIEVALVNAFAGAPHLHLEDGFGPEEADRQLARRVWTRRFALARSQVIVPSLKLAAIATEQWRLDRARVSYIPNGIAAQQGFKTDLGTLGLDLRPGLPRIVWAGALRPEKNPLRLLRAFAPLRDKAHLLVIGDGPERGAILEEAERLGLGDSLRLLGRRTDVRDLVIQCDMLALSSDTEQMPFCVLEAMDAGLPVASVDVGDVRTMVAAENRPYITPLDDAALARSLADLAASPRLRAAVGKANRRRVRETYDLSQMVRAHEDLILRAARRTAPR
jgi:glycosyltransferase involved in cell wall biosynthesis